MALRNRLRCVVIAVLMLVAAAVASAAPPATQPWPGITLGSQQAGDRPQSVHIVTVDLAARGVSLHVRAGGEDPDGHGPWDTSLLDVLAIAQRERFALAVNAGFFAVESDARSPLRRYREGTPSASIGITMCDGVLRSRGGPKPRPAVIVGGDGKVRLDVVPPIPAQARQIVTGNFWLVRDGRRVLDPGEDPPEPRTAVGIDRGGKILTILVADGRRPWAPGLSLKQTADVMVARGCVAAINFDGGGSTTLVVRDPESGEYETLNTPSDGRLRPVANALCIQVTEDSSAAAQPAP